MLHYYATYRLQGIAWVTTIVARNCDESFKSHARPEYSYGEAELTAVWLNERVAGYPVPAKLARFQEVPHVVKARVLHRRSRVHSRRTKN